MFFRILKRDFLRNKSITIILFLFILLAALLVSSGVNVIVELKHSVDYLLDKADIPHYVQMNSGEISRKDIDDFSKTTGMVKKQQNVEMLNIDGAEIYFGSSPVSEADSVMDMGFVAQNKEFDYLLNLKDELVQVNKGEIAVPIYYMERHHLKIGDKVRISGTKLTKEFVISDFVRDAIMNPSIINSKRFVVNEADWKTLRNNTGEVEYLIEFQLKNLNMLKDFGNLYQSSTLPKKGPSIGYNLFLLLNAVTDGIMVAVMLLVSILLVIIAVLCLRFTILAALEEDYREIGVMKAIGISGKDIKRIYLVKYTALTVSACFAGYLLSFAANSLLTSNIALYIGLAPQSLMQIMVPILGAALIGLIIILSCMLILGKLNRISAVEALRSGNTGDLRTVKTRINLYNSKIVGTNLFLGIKDVFSRFRIYGLLLAIFIISSFIIIVPVNLLNTIKSPDFMSYMGVGKSEVRIDMQQTESVAQRFKSMVRDLKEDKDIEKLSALVTCRFRMKSEEGTLEGLNVETGDQSVFPLKYLKGKAPASGSEIALSYLCAKNSGKKVGDSLILLVSGQEKTMTVCGIYQDITNGGITAKAMLNYDSDNALWYVVNLDFKPGVITEDKIKEYSKRFAPAQVTEIKDYTTQTLGELIKQLKFIALAAVFIGILLAVLITSFFLKLLTAKDIRQNAIMKSLGFSREDIRLQYIVRMLAVLMIGIMLGTLAANTLGEMLTGAILSGMGAAKLQFVINPLQSYLLCPLGFVLAVTAATFIQAAVMQEVDIRQTISE